MKRAIVAPPALAASALAELKAWLGISMNRDDAELTSLLKAALDLCEGFIGAMPLSSGCEELLAASGEWQSLATRPIQAITGVSAVAVNGTRSTLASGDYEIDIFADGTGLVRLRRTIDQTRIAVRFTAGLADDWATLPEALRHGVMRLAAFQHRNRDSAKELPGPPAAVAALWRPWRRVRLA